MKFQSTFNSICAKMLRITVHYNYQPFTLVLKQCKPKILKRENIKKYYNPLTTNFIIFGARMSETKLIKAV